MKNSLIFSILLCTLCSFSFNYASDAKPKKDAELAVLSESAKTSIAKMETDFNRITGVTKTQGYLGYQSSQGAHAMSVAIQLGALLKDSQQETLKSVDLIHTKIDLLRSRIDKLETQVAAISR